ncbi:hypothetical protein PN498_10145 [Oscillatoria sp. CS-180]|uniref:hypothetical protein n=1 Tax=Oscillatoria sp. CS-180 TaxID=3021720 RepID=UPI00232F3A88|nr:hypothetical protein [Oscillatoria sp. CS-180]MDB9526347.1 hypothetical protein [Oscillatoria sp. CS-180]
MISSDLMKLQEKTSRLDRNQVQLALAIADTALLKSLLVDCTPAIALPHQINQLKVTVGPPPGQKGAEHADAVIEYEQLWCTPSEGAPNEDHFSVKDYQSLTRCQSELKTLGWRISLSDAIALLQHGGFQESQIQRILQLPWEGWYRSWWDTFEPQGHLGLPFQRWFRTRCYSDGTYTLQYRDHYAQDAPPCFRGIWQQVPVVINQAAGQFGETLTGLKKACHTLNAQRCILLADELLTDLEAEGYIRQGVSLYPLQQSALAEQSLCQRCDRNQCPMRHQQNAPIINCRDYVSYA